MRSILLAAMAIPAVIGEALAETLSLVCENPRQEYLVSYDPALSTVHADDTLYRVLAVEETPERLVVVGLTVNERVSDLLCMSDPVHASPKGSMHDDLQGTSG
jgi:hypothetical protein